MAIRGFHPIPARIIQVLKDFLPAELDLIDADESQDATPDIGAGDYWEYLKPLVADFPAVRIDVVGMSPEETLVDSAGQLPGRLTGAYQFDIWADVQIDTAVQDALSLQKLVTTYSMGIFRVLCILKDGLQTTADDTRFAHTVVPGGDVRVVTHESPSEGNLVRSGVVPIIVTRIETR